MNRQVLRSQIEKKTGWELNMRQRVHTLQYDFHGGAVVANAYRVLGYILRWVWLLLSYIRGHVPPVPTTMEVVITVTVHPNVSLEVSAAFLFLLLHKMFVCFVLQFLCCYCFICCVFSNLKPA